MTDQVKQIGNYTYNQRFCLGEGSFGKVYEGLSKSNKKVAIKKVDKKLINSDEYLKNSIESEINILKKFNHPNIVKLEEVVFTANSIYIVTEFCKNGDLKTYLRTRKPKEDQCIKILVQLINGFKQIVKQGIIHRDLKPPNVLVHEGIFKICDFGFAKYFKDVNRMNRTCVGTPMYMSPQTLKQKPYTNKSDIWSLGIVFYEMMFGKTPWQGGVEDQLYQNIISKPLYIPTCSKFSSTILKSMLEVDEVNRWSWDRVFEYVQKQNGQKKIQKTEVVVEKPSNDINFMNFFKKNGDQYTKPNTTENITREQNFFAQFQDDQRNSEIGVNISRNTQRDVKVKPKNMLAYFLDEEQVVQNPRFCYFILVQLYLNPLKVPSFEIFLSALHQYTIQAYINIIQKQKGSYRQLLTNELKQIRQMQPLKSKSVSRQKAREAGIQVLAESQKILNMSRQWIKRFVDRRYSYDPL